MDKDYLFTEELHKWFPIKKGLFGRTSGYLKAVDGVSLSVKRHETLGVVGESGCGKTTLGLMLLRLTEPSKGRIYFDGTEISKLKGGKLKPFRRRMQIVFQDPYASLDPRQTVRSALTEPIRLHGLANSQSEAKEMVNELIARVGLSATHLARFPHEFSGGQRQRIAIAKALAVQPKFIVLDEPTSSLDVSVQAQILNLLKRLQEDLDLTYLFISHNLAVIRQICDRVAVMYLGRIVEIAPTEKIFQNPKHPYTRALFSSVPAPDPSRRKELVALEGDVPSPVDIPTGCRFRTRCEFVTEDCAALPPPLVEIENEHWVECLYDIDFSSQVRKPFDDGSMAPRSRH